LHALSRVETLPTINQGHYRLPTHRTCRMPPLSAAFLSVVNCIVASF
jgi:hypothetical protein